MSGLGAMAHGHGTQLALAVPLALLSALAFAVATVAQQRAAARSSDADARAGRFVGQLLRNPLWCAATLGNGGGYVLEAAALGHGSVLVVQPILVTSLLFALPLSARLAHRRLPQHVWLWGVVLTVSLATFVVVGDPNTGASHASHRGWLIVSAIGLPIVAACLILAQPRSGATRAGLLAIAVGVLGGALAVLTKTLVASLDHGVVHTLTAYETYALIAVGAAGIYVQQLAFQAGALQASLPIMIVLEPMIAAGLGLTLLHEQLRSGGWRLPLIAVAVVGMILATIELARGRAHSEPVIAAR